MSGNSIREFGDDGNTVPTIRDFIERCVSRWGGMRKSGGRIRI